MTSYITKFNKQLVRLVKSFFTLFIIFSACSVYANTEVLIWKKTPLKVNLEVGKERLIHFEDNVSIDLTGSLYKKLRQPTVAAAGVLYLTANAPFPKERITVTLASTGELIFIDLVAVETKDETDLGDVRVVGAKAIDDQAKVEAETLLQSNQVSIRQLFQHASQDWYAPDRLKNNSLPIVEKEIKKEIYLENLFMGASAGLFDLKALKTYTTNRYVLTAIEVKNRTLSPQDIVYSDIYPDYTVVVAQHVFIGPRYSDTQSTMLYLIREDSLEKDGAYSL